MRKIIIMFLLGVVGLAPVAQAQDYALKAGNIQGSVLLGKGMFYSGTDYMYLNNSPKAVGYKEPSLYLKISDPNENSLMNMIGAEFKYFVTEQIAVSFSGAGYISHTAAVDGIDTLMTGTTFPFYNYVDAELKTRVVANLGVNYYFNISSNERIHPYAGIQGTIQFAQLGLQTPYAADENTDIHLNKGVRIGQTIGWSPALVAGIEYSILPGMIVGFEVKPVSYYQSGVQLFAQPGLNAWNGIVEEFTFLSQPRFKIGFRF